MKTTDSRFEGSELAEALKTCKATLLSLAAGKPTRNLDEVISWIDRLTAAGESAPCVVDAKYNGGYIATVPDKCDRIIWRGFYHSLPTDVYPCAAGPVAGNHERRDE